MGAKPFFKHVGGKTQVVDTLIKYIPENFEAYHEPMVGGGALFWSLSNSGWLKGKQVYLSDINPKIIEAYQAVRDYPDQFIESLELYKRQYYKDPESLYYRIRDAWNAGHQPPASFVFLKQTSFNGLWRCNRQGKINMSWGKYKNPNIVDPETIRQCSQSLQGVSLECAGFEKSGKQIKTGDVVYYDPPYWGTFDLYTSDGFGMEKHLDLLRLCSSLSRNCVRVIYSNEDSKKFREILESYWYCDVTTVPTRRYVNCSGVGREPVDDLIVVGKY